MAKLRAESEGKEKAGVSLSHSFASHAILGQLQKRFLQGSAHVSWPWHLGAAVPDGTVRTDQKKQEDESHSYPSDFNGELVPPLQSVSRKELIHNSLPSDLLITIIESFQLENTLQGHLLQPLH